MKYQVQDTEGNWYEVEAKSIDEAHDLLDHELKLAAGEDLGAVPSLETGARLAAKGVPILNKFVDETDETKNYEKHHPKKAMGLKVLGGVGAGIPVAAAATSLAPATVAGTTMLGPMITNGIAGGAIGAADEALNPNASWGDVGKRATLDALLNFGATGAGGIISQKGKTIPGVVSPSSAMLQSLHKAVPSSKLLKPIPPPPPPQVIPNSFISPEILPYLQSGTVGAAADLFSSGSVGHGLVGALLARTAYDGGKYIAKRNNLFAPSGPLGTAPPALATAGGQQLGVPQSIPFLYPNQKEEQ